MRFMGMTGLQREGYASLRLIFGTKQGRLNYLANQEIIWEQSSNNGIPQYLHSRQTSL